MSAHTKGPWLSEGRTIYALESTGQWRKGIEQFHNRMSASVFVCQGVPEAESDANARLIAKAPELFDCVKELRAALAGAMRVIEDAVSDKSDITDCFVDEMARLGIANGIGKRADDLIAKIEGEP